MAKKKFEEVEYDPIEAEAKRQLARTVSSPSQASNIVPIQNAKETVIDLPPLRDPQTEPKITRSNSVFEHRQEMVRESFQQREKTPEVNTAPQRKEKKRSFSCASVEQDSELDSFILRVQEAAGTHVPFQVLMRAACIAMLSAEDQLMGELKKIHAPTFPAKFAHAKYAEFEEFWIQVVQKAIRKSRSFMS